MPTTINDCRECGKPARVLNEWEDESSLRCSYNDSPENLSGKRCPTRYKVTAETFEEALEIWNRLQEPNG
jgi:hypothetical protein